MDIPMDPIQCVLKDDLNHLEKMDGKDIVKFRDNNGDSALSVAVWKGKLKFCEVIYKKCQDLLYDNGGKKSFSPLHTAVFKRHDQIVKFLIYAKSEMEKKDNEVIVVGSGQADSKLLKMSTELGLTALHIAAQRGFFKSAKLLIEADPNNELLKISDNRGETPMHLAVREHRVEIVRLLLETDPGFDYPENGAGQIPLLITLEEAGSKSVKNNEQIKSFLIRNQSDQCKKSIGNKGRNLLHYAAEKQDLSAVDLITSLYPDYCKSTDDEKENFLHLACKCEATKVVEHVVRNTNVPEQVFNDLNSSGKTALEIAIEKKYEAIILLLLNDKRVNKMEASDYHSVPPDLWIRISKKMSPTIQASKGEIDILRIIHLDALKSPDDINGDTVLTIAAKMNQLNCCRVIYERCNELLHTKNQQGYTPLHEAAIMGHNEIVEFLIFAPAGETPVPDLKLLQETDRKGYSALHLAVKKSRLKTTKILIRSAPRNTLLKLAGNRHQETALHIAVKIQHLEIVKLLVQAEPLRIYSANKNGQTPLLLALENAVVGDQKKVAIRKYLIMTQSIQCSERIGPDGWTLLHYATYRGDLDSIKEILEYNSACSNSVDNSGKNFLHIAAQCGHENVVKYILGWKYITETILNGKDANGDSALHFATAGNNEGLILSLLYDPRVKTDVKNLAQESATPRITFKYSTKKAKYGYRNRVDEEELKNRSDYDLLVAALICTVSFTVAITVPGGITADGPLYKEKNSFKVLMVANSISFALSLYAVFGHFCMKFVDDENYVARLLNIASICLLGAIFALMVAFGAASLAVLDFSLGLCWTIGGICVGMLVGTLFPMWKMVRYKLAHFVWARLKNCIVCSKESPPTGAAPSVVNEPTGQVALNGHPVADQETEDGQSIVRVPGQEAQAVQSNIIIDVDNSPSEI